MKKIALLFIGIFFVHQVVAQNLSNKIQSITQNHLNKVRSPHQKKIVQTMLNKRGNTSLTARLDTIQFDYLYIEETFNIKDSNYHIAEYYFSTKPKGLYNYYDAEKHILPDMLFSKGNLIDHRYAYFSASTSGVVFHDLYEYYYTLDTIISRCEKLLPIQTLSYDRTPNLIRYKDKKSYGDVETTMQTKMLLEEEHCKLLENTYQIITFVHANTNTIKVSLQSPAQHPKINSYSKTFEYRQW